MTTATTPAEPTALVRRETLNNILIGIAISAFATGRPLRDPPLRPALAKIAGVFGVVLPICNVTFLITLGTTLLANLRVREGRAGRAGQQPGRGIHQLVSIISLNQLIKSNDVSCRGAPSRSQPRGEGCWR